jgi:hypothetical protein
VAVAQGSRTVTTAARWGFTALWATLPLTAGPAFADALDERSSTFRTSCSTGLWLCWVLVLAASLVPRSPTLTATRLGAVGGALAAAWAALAGPTTDVADIVAVTAAVAAAAVSLTAWFGDVYVDGDSYGDERRFLLRIPGPLVLGPVPLAAVAALVGAAAGPLLVAAGSPILGVLALLVGWPAAFVCVRALHVQTQRTLIFVPGGVVVHDLTALAVPVLLRKGRVVALGVAPADTRALDLTRSAIGAALEVRLAEPERLPVVRRRGRTSEPAEDVDADALLVAPSRLGAVVATARQRGLIRG